MLISEIYRSRQGEGILTGTPSIFIRTSGCNLRCRFCDTPFASWRPEGEKSSIAEIVQQAVSIRDRYPETRHVVLTGGEPMLPRSVVELTQAINSNGFHITIETAGTLFRSVRCDLMSISPKFANSDPSHERAGEWAEKHRLVRLQPQVVQELVNQYPHQLKFVIDVPENVEEILGFLQSIDGLDRSRILLMPQGIELEELKKRESWLSAICDQHGFQLCRRMHIQWYGNRRGT